MKRLLLLLVLLAPTICGAAQLIFDSDVISGQSIAVNDISITLWVDKAGGQLVVDTDPHYTLIPLGLCSEVNNTFICYRNYSYDFSTKKYSAEVDIYDIKPVIKITRTIDDPTLLLDEEATVSVTVNNTGGTPTQLDFEDPFPQEFSVVDISGCNLTGNKVTWSSALKMNRSFECEYTIKAQSHFSGQLKARATYFDGISEQEIFSDPLTLSVTEFLDYDVTVEDDQIYLGEETIVSFNITNNDDDETDILATIIFPEGLQASPRTGFVHSQDNRTFTWSSNLESGETKHISFTVKGIAPGASGIRVLLSYVNEHRSYDTSAEKYVKVESPPLLFTTTLPNQPSYDSTQEVRFFFGIRNPNPFAKLINIDIQFTTELVDTKFTHIGYLDEGDSRAIYSANVVLPHVEEAKKYDFNLSASYSTEYGQTYTSYHAHEITVQPRAALSVTQHVSHTQVEEGSVVTVKVTLMNNRKVDIDEIRVKDTIYPYLPREGVTLKTISIPAETSSDVYTYKIRTEEVDSPTRYWINTSVYFVDDDPLQANRYVKLQELLVNPKSINVGLSQHIGGSEIFQGKMIPVKVSVTNHDSEPIYNARLVYAPSEKYELIAKEKVISLLYPGTSTEIENAYYIRQYNNESATLKGIILEYEDKQGNRFNSTSNEIGLVARWTYIQGPLAMLTRSIDVVGSEAAVQLVATNLGDVGIPDLEIQSGNRLWHTALNARESQTYKYSIALVPGENLIGSARGEYSYLGNTHTIFVGDEPVEYSPEIAEVPETEPDENINIEEPIIEEQEPEGFWSSVLAWLRRIFLWKRG